MTASKNCSQCSKPLRSDNTKGICGDRYACGTRTAALGGGMDLSAKKLPEAIDVPVIPRGVAARGHRPPDVARRVTPALTDAVSRFKVVADALGFDGAGMLEQYAQTWLDDLCSKAGLAQKPATVKHRQSSPPPAPVRLQGADGAGQAIAADAGAGA